MKGSLFLALFLLLSGVVFYVLKGSKDLGKSVVYNYRLSSSGGMGPQLQIESEWAGQVTVSPTDTPHEFLVLPSSTQAKILINGEERQDLVRDPLKDFERTIKVILDPANGLTKSIEFESGLDQAALMSVLENQLRNLAHLLFIPSISLQRNKFHGPCLTGLCEYRLESSSTHSYSIVRKSLSGLHIEARYEVRTDEEGILEIKGSEGSVGTDNTGAQTRTSFHLKRLSFDSAPLRVVLKNVRNIGPSLPEMSEEQKRTIVSAQLQGVTLETIMDNARKLSPDSDEWGPLFVQLKDLIWLNQNELKNLTKLLKKTKPEERFFTTGVNALSAQGTPESQEALKELAKHFKKNPKVSQSLLISLAQTKNPTASTLDHLTELAKWDDQGASASETLLARRLTGVLARTMGDTPESGALINPALDGIEQTLNGQNKLDEELIELIDAVGNSGHSSIEGPLSRLITGPYSIPVRTSAVSALRFVPGPGITNQLLETSKGQDQELARSARGALELRCSLMPAECSEEIQTWLKN